MPTLAPVEVPRTILIAGPTASGKSAFALRLAEALGGVVVNADSMQVYRELRILTARPGPADEARAPHALYGFVAASEAYSAGRFVADAARVIAEATAAGRRPILVGGTGLYSMALLEGLSPIPPVPPEIRARRRADASARGTAALHAELARRDPATAARLAPGDTQRIVRALEVLDATGRSLGEWQRLPRRPVLAAEQAVRLVIETDRAELYRRCEARFDAMLAQGALAEAARLEALGLAADLPAMAALGVRPLLAHLSGELTLDAAVARAKTDTRHYAKRQLTWIRRNMIAWRRLSQQQVETLRAEEIIFSPA